MENFKIIPLNTANLWAFWSPRDICFRSLGPHVMEKKIWHKPEGHYRTRHPSVLLLAKAPGDQRPFAISHVCSPSPAPTDISEALNKFPEEKAGKPSYRWCIPNDLEILMRTRTGLEGEGAHLGTPLKEIPITDAGFAHLHPYDPGPLLNSMSWTPGLSHPWLGSILDFVFLGIEPSVPCSEGRKDVLHFKYGESKILKIPTVRRQTIRSQVALQAHSRHI